MNLYSQAIDRFRKLYNRIRKSNLVEPSAVTLATADGRGRPAARVVLLKEFDESGFIFYTNQKSRKGRELAENPRAALCFFWDPLDVQVRVEGRVKKVSRAEADEYWAIRPRESQVAAWASFQSQRLNKRSTFQARVKFYFKKYAQRRIPRPPHWSGYRIIPNRIEFWKRRPFRMHDRVLYSKSGSKWSVTLLYP